ncbi:MAG: ferredoxin-thioredoxin reductase catalytic domain-containing protein [Clostridia bacterium]|jgi:ferredoxin-thioredoxin reductase catalytic subunit|nr:ferredoxin-thioredoxin reductase catalytic domain-containing protein [Spirochaetia bacterium]
MAEKTIQDTATFVSMVAKKQGWTLNPDSEFTASLVEGLTVNFNRYGYYLCPCRDTEGSRQADTDVLCPCKYSWDDVAQAGHCFCALFLRPDFAESGQQPAGIPDRRFQSS